MPYAIITQDKPDHAEVRASNRPEHLEYLKANQKSLLAAGALLKDDGSPGEGGILIVDTEDRAVAERFIADDPFTKAGLFQSVVVTRWRKAFFDGQCLV
jgi:uncharacterized protein YciI